MELAIVRPTAAECKACEVPEKVRDSCEKIFKKRGDITDVATGVDCVKGLIIKCRVVIKRQ